METKCSRKDLKFNQSQQFIYLADWLVELWHNKSFAPLESSPTPQVTSKTAGIARRTLEAACWLGCWGNHVANSHLCLGPFNSRVLRSCLVPQCSQQPHWSCHQRRFANCDRMPASHTSGQSSYSRPHPTSWVSSQRSRNFSSTPCYGVWSSAQLSYRAFAGWENTPSGGGTPFSRALLEVLRE